MNLGKQFNLHKALMEKAWSEEEAQAEYDTACAIRQKMCTGKCAMSNCERCFLTKAYNDVCKDLKTHPDKQVTINLFGCNVTINTR